MKRLACCLLGSALAPSCTQTPADDPSTDTGSGADDSDASASLSGDASTSATADDSTGANSSADASTSAGSTAADDATESGDPECGVGAQCADAAPAGWFGPAIYARTPDGVMAPECPAEFNAPGPSVLEGWSEPGPALCECECELSSPLNCTAYTYTHANASCNSFTQYTPVTTTCTNATITNWSNFYSYAQNVPMCMETSSEVLPSAQWDAAIRSCKVDDAGLACGDGGTCTPVAPEGFEAAMCVYKDGDNECPAGAYSNKLLFYSNFEDTRECSNCSCGAVQATCSAPMLVFEEPDCAGEPVGEVAPGGACVQISGASIAMDTDTGGCSVSDPSVPMGAAAPIGPFTFCCQAD